MTQSSTYVKGENIVLAQALSENAKFVESWPGLFGVCPHRLDPTFCFWVRGTGSPPPPPSAAMVVGRGKGDRGGGGCGFFPHPPLLFPEKELSPNGEFVMKSEKEKGREQRRFSCFLPSPPRPPFGSANKGDCSKENWGVGERAFFRISIFISHEKGKQITNIQSA